jgi:hypothetical protein
MWEGSERAVVQVSYVPQLRADQSCLAVIRVCQTLKLHLIQTLTSPIALVLVAMRGQVWGSLHREVGRGGSALESAVLRECSSLQSAIISAPTTVNLLSQSPYPACIGVKETPPHAILPNIFHTTTSVQEYCQHAFPQLDYASVLLGLCWFRGIVCYGMLFGYGGNDQSWMQSNERVP